MSDLLEDIVKALRNLGGVATIREIYPEVERIRNSSMSKTWPKIVQQTIEFNSSDTKVFKGIDVFHKVGVGKWELRDKQGIVKPLPKADAVLSRKMSPSSGSEFQETSANYLRTIKEYREFANPASSSWTQYIQEFFHILGFSTESSDSRLLLLKDLGGSNNNSIALVGVILPGENESEISPGLKWEDYLLDAANKRRIQWGILTNGLMLKVFSYSNPQDQQPIIWQDLDEMINDQKADDFSKFYEVILSIQGKHFHGDHTLMPTSRLGGMISSFSQTPIDYRQSPRYNRKPYTPAEKFHIPLLQALENLGGSADIDAVRSELEYLLASVLTEADKQTLPSTPGFPAWYESAHGARHNLVHAGLMVRDIPRDCASFFL